jgi:serine/threonine protein kinase
MLVLLTCPRGHFWEQPGGADGAVCPECGAPPEALPLLDLAPEAPRTPVPPQTVASIEAALFDGAGRPVVRGYEILEDLGRTSAGVRRYLAKQFVVNRHVLLEVVLAREDAGQRGYGSLRGAASALGKLSHPNILSVHEAGERDRQLFYNALEWIDGPSLCEKVADRPLPFSQVLRLMQLLARAIDHAHARGVLHRNLRPSSILLQPVDPPRESLSAGDPGASACLLHKGWYWPRITDFGQARRPVEGDPNDVELYGEQPGFLSPEQAWGRSDEICGATDVYGLGSILYFLLTGRAPFRGPTLPDVLDAIQTANLLSPADAGTVPADLDAICRKCLRRQPRRRYASAGALADDLRRAQQSLPLTCRHAGGGERFAKWLRRQPAVAALILVAVLGIVGSVVGYAVGESESTSEALIQAQRELEFARREAAHLRNQLDRARQKE